ncbi:MAG: pentapeptide repeat-containing protein [Saprospiraceae bacterium]
MIEEIGNFILVAIFLLLISILGAIFLVFIIFNYFEYRDAEKRKMTLNKIKVVLVNIPKNILGIMIQIQSWFFLFAGFIAFCILWYIDEYQDPSGFNLHDVIVEAHGVLYDLLVFGFLISFYDSLREKKDKILRLREEIEDYQGRLEDEAKFRVTGAIKRLNKLGITDIDISNCYLKGANLKGVNLYLATLNGAILSEANLQGANLQGANLKNVNLDGSDLTNANLRGCDLQGINLSGIKLKAVDFQGANLKGACLEGVNLQMANLKSVELEGARVDKNWFELLKKWGLKTADIEKKYIIEEDQKLWIRMDYDLFNR